MDPNRIIGILNKENGQNWLNEKIQNRESIKVLIKETNDTGLIKFSLNELPLNLVGE